MKLSLLTYLLGKDLELGELLQVCRASGIPGVEFRAELDHKHGVELERTPEERAEIRQRCADADIAVACLATGCKFEYAEADKRQEDIDRAKRFVDLAADIGAPRIRVFGNAFPAEGIDRAEVVENVGAALREIAEHGATRDVDVCLEMHGDFYWWEHTLNAVRIADHPRVGVVHNCDPREMKFGPIANFYEPVKTYVRHVHMHDLENGYPYQALMAMLKRDGYSGYFSLEAGASEEPRRVIAIYAALFRAWLETL
ncbi:MAG: sugar phosphate isomerase/epimerase [Armatimonadetes bacterium]|nr:sugar phosphate isomerase/epimerase [Armatimonadota bacterium]